MANETIIIDVQSKFTDNASAGLKSAGLQADRYKTKLDGATKASEKLGGTKVKPKLGAPTDHATPVFKKVLGLGRSFGRKTYKATVDVNDQASGKIRGLSSKIFSLKSLLTGVTAGVAAKKAIIDPIGVADFLTTAQIGFETMLGSKKKADKFMRDVKNFAVDTPFETQDVVSNAQRMLSVGWNRKNVLKDMNRIGNQSAATGTGAAGIERVTTALGQMRMKGKVSAEEMLQLTESNVKAWEYVAKGEGVSVAKAQEMVTKGLIPVDKAINSILTGMDEFDGMMDETANRTAGGLKSQLQDTFQNKYVEKWGRGLQTGAIKGMAKLLDYLEEMSPKMDKWGDVLEEVGEDLSTGLVNKLESAGNRLDKLFSDEKFQNASLGGKLDIAWDELIAQPFSDWWDSSGKEKITTKLKEIGTEALVSIKDVFTGSLKDLLPGGDKAGIEDYLIGLFTIKKAGKLFSWLTEPLGGEGGNPLSGSSLGTINISAALVNVNGKTSPPLSDGKGDSGKKDIWLPDSAKKQGKGKGKTTPDIPDLPETQKPKKSRPKTRLDALKSMPGKTKGLLTKVGTKLGSGATTSAGTAATGAAGIAGAAGTLMGLVSAAKSFLHASKAKGEKTKNKETYSGAAKLGLTSGGALAGAVAGSIVPGIGTALGALIGGGLGGAAAFFGGDKLGKKATKAHYANERNTKKHTYKQTRGQYYNPEHAQEAKKLRKSAGKSTDSSERKLTDSTKKATKETKSYSRESESASRTVKSYASTTSGAGSKVNVMGGQASAAGGNVGIMGGQALTAGGNVSALGTQATLVASVLASAAATIRSAAAQAKSAAAGKTPNTKLTPPMAVKKNARGNYIGSHIVSELGEEGPEMVIPLSNHRNRALKLWEQAGNILGVKRYARGGIAGQGKIRGTRGTSSSGVQVNVASGAIQITVQAGGSGDIVTAIRSGRKEITDAILNAIVDACGTSYTNRTAEVM